MNAPMDGETVAQLAAGLQTAMRAEHQGYHFYRMAAGNTSDARGTDMFTQLAAEEQEHLAFLEKQYRSIIETGMPSAGATLGAPLALSGTSPIFSDRLRSRLSDAHYEMTALSVGIQLELDAVRVYTQLANDAAIPEVAAFYRELAEWERGHYDALLAQETTLKEAYWAGNGFAPF